MTPDDLGRAAVNTDLQPRARQNVILELGFFVGCLGRKRVCALYRGPLELPSDILGVIFIELDPAGGWQLKLAREIKQAGLPIDLNRAIGGSRIAHEAATVCIVRLFVITCKDVIVTITRV